MPLGAAPHPPPIFVALQCLLVAVAAPRRSRFAPPTAATAIRPPARDPAFLCCPHPPACLRAAPSAPPRTAPQPRAHPLPSAPALLWLAAVARTATASPNAPPGPLTGAAPPHRPCRGPPALRPPPAAGMASPSLRASALSASAPPCPISPNTRCTHAR
nr:protein transport protein sec31-like [Aegilops tauschii subsp. strangulata]